MNIIVTGGAGYIGSNIALALLDAGYEVTIIDNLSTGNERLIPSKAEFVKCNINDIEKLENLINKKKFTAIMHFAGFVEVEESVSYPEKYLKIIQQIPLNYLIFVCRMACQISFFHQRQLSTGTRHTRVWCLKQMTLNPLTHTVNQRLELRIIFDNLIPVK